MDEYVGILRCAPVDSVIMNVVIAIAIPITSDLEVAERPRDLKGDLSL